jgi:catechol 2,3-dioxygenase-like lactoylglutathione lyase family enzyme
MFHHFVVDFAPGSSGAFVLYGLPVPEKNYKLVVQFLQIMYLSAPSTALFVKDIRVSRLFYEKLLQLQVELDFGKNIIFKGGLAIWEIQDYHIIPQTLGLKNISDQGVNRFELYFETENLEEIHTKLKEYPVRFLHEIHEEKWGQQTIRFFDPDNHLIEIGESMRQFVTRFFKQGLTPEQISLKTSVPVDEVKRLID